MKPIESEFGIFEKIPVIHKRFENEWGDLPIIGLGDMHVGARETRLDMIENLEVYRNK